MKKITVHLGKRSYDILVGAGLLSRLGYLLSNLNLGCDAYIITNRLIKDKYGSLITKALDDYGISVKFRVVADTEKSKSIRIASAVIDDLSLYDIRRRVFIIAFGGGVIGDLAGFVASIYKRGIPYVQVPTTLLAQVDSGIGGKTAVDLSSGKNMVGSFYQPRLVLSDTDLLKSLDPRQIISGISEVIKYSLIRDKALFAYLKRNRRAILGLKGNELEHVVGSCSRIKADIVSSDEKEEKGLRTILNFGHTLGHAIECAGGYTLYNHGEAVALGMLLACGISCRMGMLKDQDYRDIESLISGMGLPVRIKGLSVSRIIKSHYRDKKFIGQKNRFVLLGKIGKAVVVSSVPLDIIEKAIKERL